MVDSIFPRTPAWLTPLLFTALGAMVISPLFSRMPAVLNGGALLGLFAMTARHFLAPSPLITDRFLKTGLLIFLASALLSTFSPLVYLNDSQALLTQCLHRYGDTLKAFLAGALVLACLQSRRDLATSALIFCLLTFAITLWAPFHFWLKGEFVSYLMGHLRLEGTKGNSHRYAMVLYYLIVPVAGLLFSPRLLSTVVTPGVIRTGYGICLCLPFFLIRSGLPPEALQGSWVPLGSSPAAHKSFYVLVSAVMLISLFFWRFLVRPGRSRLCACLLILSLLAINLALTAVRMQFFLSILLILGILLLQRWFRLIWVALPVILMAGGITFLKASEPAGNLSSLSERVLIWHGCLELAGEHWLCGAGYGQSAFQNAWTRKFLSLPQGEDSAVTQGLTSNGQITLKAYHAHNLWLQLLVERGVLGLLCFHLLWASALFSLYRSNRRQALDSAGRPLLLSVLLLLSFLAVDGIINWPLIGYNELFFVVLIALGLAAGKMTQEEGMKCNLRETTGKAG